MLIQLALGRIYVASAAVSGDALDTAKLSLQQPTMTCHLWGPMPLTHGHRRILT